MTPHGTGSRCVPWLLAADGGPLLRATYYPPHQGRRYPCLCTLCWEPYGDGSPPRPQPLPRVQGAPVR